MEIIKHHSFKESYKTVIVHNCDFSRAAEFKTFLIEEWGEKSATLISNYGTFHLKSLVKDISKFYNVSFQEVNEVTTKMVDEALPKAKQDHEQVAGVYEPTYEEVKAYSPSFQAFLRKYPSVASHIENLQGMVKSIGQHAAGLVWSDNLHEKMPLISAKGSFQSPWSEGQAVRHLEPLGFIKFDILGLQTLTIIEDTIKHILHKRKLSCGIKEIIEFYNRNLHPDVINFDDQKVWETVFHKKKNLNLGIFQFSNDGAQSFCVKVKPTSIEDLSAVTSIYRPGPLGSNIDKKYLKAKRHPETVTYLHPCVEPVLKSTYGFVIYQEQIAKLAVAIGKDVSLMEGNSLRKLLTKKGLIGNNAEKKEKIYKKFVEGGLEKGIEGNALEELWKSLELFNNYGFNLSHSCGYSILSYQCAWLFTYYQSEWVAAFLNSEPEKTKAKAISDAKSIGFTMASVDINKSSLYDWDVSPDNKKELIQPLFSLLGMGKTAVEQISYCRPYNKIEDVLFKEDIWGKKLNKKYLDVLTRSGALDSLMDERFTGDKHFWSCVAVIRPKDQEDFEENIKLYSPEGSFAEKERLIYRSQLTGVYPVDQIVSPKDVKALKSLGAVPVSEWEVGKYVWFVLKSVEFKQTLANKKDYAVLTVVDNTGEENKIKCWNVKDYYPLVENSAYVGVVTKDEKWGFSTNKKINEAFRKL